MILIRSYVGLNLSIRSESSTSWIPIMNLQITSCDASAIVEVLTEVDSKQITTGAKRNNLLNKAQGKYICFIDDDDHIYPNYIKLILEAIEWDADCIATTGIYTVDNGRKVRWKLATN